MQNKYVAYVRVSSEKQGRSGLGLQAQKDIIMHNVGGENIVGWYEEVHTGKNLNFLPQLILAKERAKKESLILVLAKTDRLRNTQQALDLVDELTPGGVFFCNVGRNADKFMLTLFFAFAEKERLEISIRTKAALAVLKSKGVKLGRPFKVKPKTYYLRIAKIGGYARFLKSINDPHNISAFNVSILLRQRGFTYQEIANYLNGNGHITPNCSFWRAAGVLRLIRKYLKYLDLTIETMDREKAAKLIDHFLLQCKYDSYDVYKLGKGRESDTKECKKKEKRLCLGQEA